MSDSQFVDKVKKAAWPHRFDKDYSEEKMDRERAIRHIESLYPPDSEYPDTAAIGRELLEEAKLNAGSWRNEPTEVLVEFARLAIARESQ